MWVQCVQPLKSMLDEVHLSHPFLQVSIDNGVSYGGNQSWSGQERVRKNGCGLIGCTDVLLYLQRYHENGQSKLLAPSMEPVLTKETYLNYVEKVRKHYFPIIPPFGMTGWQLVLALNLYFVRWHIPLRASWGMGSKHFWSTIEEMLKKDLPVILAIGPNFPNWFGKKAVRFYVKQGQEIRSSSVTVKAHYVTVTALMGEWIQVSSWGKCYYIKRSEYWQYVRHYSNFLVSNCVVFHHLGG